MGGAGMEKHYDNTNGNNKNNVDSWRVRLWLGNNKKFASK